MAALKRAVVMPANQHFSTSSGPALRTDRWAAPDGRKTGMDESAGAGCAAAYAPSARINALSGIRARTSVPPPGGLSSSSVPSNAPTRSPRPRGPCRRRPAPRPRRRRSPRPQPPISAAMRTVASCAWAYLTTLVSASETKKYAASRRGQPVVRRLDDRDRQRQAGGQGLTAGPSPRSVRTAGWMPEARSAQLRDARVRLLDGLRAQLRPPPGPRALALGHLEVEDRADELLLGPVVEISSSARAPRRWPR